MNILSSSFTVQWDSERQLLLIIHPDREQFDFPLVEIRASTLDEMGWEKASQFIGERLILLIPELREKYIDPATGRLYGIQA